MIIRKLEKTKFEEFHNSLKKYAHTEPLEAFYTVDFFLNKKEYSVRLQPEGDCKIAVLQAYEVERDEYGANFFALTDKTSLTCLLDTLLKEGIPTH